MAENTVPSVNNSNIVPYSHFYKRKNCSQMENFETVGCWSDFFNW